MPFKCNRMGLNFQALPNPPKSITIPLQFGIACPDCTVRIGLLGLPAKISLCQQKGHCCFMTLNPEVNGYILTMLGTCGGHLAKYSFAGTNRDLVTSRRRFNRSCAALFVWCIVQRYFFFVRYVVSGLVFKWCCSLSGAL